MDLPPPPSPGPLAFRDPADSLRGLEPAAAARVLGAGNDVAIVLDREGVVRDIAVGSSDLGEDPFAGWIDRPFIETVTPESRAKVQEMLAEVASRGTPRWRQLNHPAGDGQVPVRYLAMEAGGDGRVIAVGREMKTAMQLQQRMIQLQQAMERDYVRLRQTEQRYRLLFDLTSEAVLIVDGSTRRIAEANAAAESLLSSGLQLAGQPLTRLFAAPDQDHLLQYLGAILSGAPAAPESLRLVSGATVTLLTALFRQEGRPLLMIRLLPDESGDRPAEATLATVLERIPDAFLLADSRLVVQAANAAFLDLAHVPRAEQAVGQPLSRFLGRSEMDLDIILAQLRREGVVRNLQTRLRGRNGSGEEVEVSAVAVERDGAAHFGFAIRSIARRLLPQPEATHGAAEGLPRSVEQLTELVGRVSLKDIVRESTDLIERLCIEAALRHTGDNRASAAEILGLSRQSLYSKLHRHGLAGLGPDAAD